MTRLPLSIMPRPDAGWGSAYGDARPVLRELLAPTDPAPEPAPLLDAVARAAATLAEHCPGDGVHSCGHTPHAGACNAPIPGAGYQCSCEGAR